MWLKNNSWIYIECSKYQNNIKTPKSWFLYKNKTTGLVNYSIYIKKTNYFIELNKNNKYTL